jgi:peroxiredoxin
VIGAGERAPDVTVWRSAEERVTTAKLCAEGPFLLLFYVLDWTST